MDSITDVSGIRVGHAQNHDAITGCSVVLCVDGATVGADVRGLAPGTRETDLCRAGTLVEQANAVLLTGGSAFGLDAAGGVMRFLHERGHGFQTGVGVVVPIVPGAVIFDLAIGQPIAPGPDMGYAACEAAGDRDVEQGCVGAGTGATVGKVLGMKQATKSGLGSASIHVGGCTVGALVVVNALGHIVRPGTNRIVAGPRDPETDEYLDTEEFLLAAPFEPAPFSNTVIGVVATDAALSSEHVNQLARMANVGLARSVRPSHTLVDGDTMFSLATGHSGARPNLLALQVAAAVTVERAILRAAEFAVPMGGLPAPRL